MLSDMVWRSVACPPSSHTNTKIWIDNTSPLNIEGSMRTSRAQDHISSFHHTLQLILRSLNWWLSNDLDSKRWFKHSCRYSQEHVFIAIELCKLYFPSGSRHISEHSNHKKCGGIVARVSISHLLQDWSSHDMPIMDFCSHRITSLQAADPLLQIDVIDARACCSRWISATKPSLDSADSESGAINLQGARHSLLLPNSLKVLSWNLPSQI